jgi:Pectate lyase superfamily protein
MDCFSRKSLINLGPMKKTPLPQLAIIAIFNVSLCLSAMAGDRINVTAYGAVPNDGLDDTAAINNATNAGQSIYFPPGTYNYSGRLTVPAGKSYRFYGDGPGVSVIKFTTTQGGIVGFMGDYSLTVEGLTLMSNSANAGTAIYASFNPSFFRTATIHNVQIVGSTRDGTSGGWWTYGIYLAYGGHSVIDKVEIAGNKNSTQNGIWLDAPGSSAATGFNISNIQVKWCNSAFKTSGHTEGLYLTGFEFSSCGRAGYAAVDMTNSGGGGAVHLVNGTVDSVGGGVFVTNQTFTKISNVRFNHYGTEVSDATLLYLNGGFGASVTHCSFYGVAPGTVANENGVFVYNCPSVQINGNNFTHMQPGNGSCIVGLGTSPSLRITDNLFSDVRSQYLVSVSGTPQPYFFGNNP